MMTMSSSFGDSYLQYGQSMSNLLLYIGSSARNPNNSSWAPLKILYSSRNSTLFSALSRQCCLTMRVSTQESTSYEKTTSSFLWLHLQQPLVDKPFQFSVLPFHDLIFSIISKKEVIPFLYHAYHVNHEQCHAWILASQSTFSTLGSFFTFSSSHW